MDKIFVRKYRRGHPWIFSNEVDELRKDIHPGTVVEIWKEKKFVGRGFYNPHSLIAIRRFSNSNDDFTTAFVKARLEQAFQLRQRGTVNNSYRLFFSESDGIPGLIIDKYDTYYVIQIHCFGVDSNKTIVVDALKSYSPACIYEKSDSYLRKLEGLDTENGVLYGIYKESVTIVQDNIKFIVDIENGQKTGFFFDLTDIRRNVQNMAYGKKVLDLFCYTGAFSLYAARGNAASVLGIDASAHAIEMAKKNADLNKCGTVGFECTNAFDFLREDKQLFNLIVLDPPSFTRSKKEVADARRGYKELNLRAMRKLKKGGILVTTCCSYHVSTETFVEILQRAERDSGVTLRIIGRGGQSFDHPVLLAMQETNYLKCFFLQRV